jgi:hypothetical protein
MREMRSKAIKVYSKLEDWIHVSNRAENSAVDEMVSFEYIFIDFSIVYCY